MMLSSQIVREEIKEDGLESANVEWPDIESYSSNNINTCTVNNLL